MIDRASIFADERMGELLRTSFIPVALDQAYQRRQQDAEGEFYRRIAGQGPRSDFRQTTQGLYVATAAGELLLYNNNRDPEKVYRLVQQAQQRFHDSAAHSEHAAPIEPGDRDVRYAPRPPERGLVVRVRARVLGGYAPTDDVWQRAFQSSLSRDNLWVTAAEHDALVRGELPATLMQRIVRFHLVDNTRGEPPMWREDEVHDLEATLERGRLSGSVRLETEDGTRSYRAGLLGFVRTEKDRVVAFDLVASGRFQGEGPYTRGAPAGEFPFAVSFTLADGTDVADAIPPQASRGWIEGYIR
ncbi:MAG TPA: hypothetical protein VFZ65_23115 [Planctomycetota bacterium]|nr:hypothetical protein [Planctomycetota bacterium]